jgi:hypothetical protein
MSELTDAIASLEARIEALETKTKNIVVFDNNPNTHILAGPNRTFAVQHDGNIVIYDADGNALWATGTNS